VTVPQSSRELAERIRDLWMEEEGEGEDINPDAAAALIDAWVRVRKSRMAALVKKWRAGKAEIDIRNLRTSVGESAFLQCADQLESALATSRKQLQEKVK